MSSDAKYIVSAGRDAKIYVRSLDAVLKQHYVDQAIVRSMHCYLVLQADFQSHSNAESAVKVKASLLFLVRPASHFLIRDVQLKMYASQS
jgi:hypothetical protein